MSTITRIFLAAGIGAAVVLAWRSSRSRYLASLPVVQPPGALEDALGPVAEPLEPQDLRIAQNSPL